MTTSSIWSSGLGQAVGVIAATTFLGLCTYVYRKTRTISTDVRDMKGVLITPKPTPLVPTPRPGLVDIVEDHGHKIDTLLLASKALIVDKAPNDGTTSRDALDRIEAEQTRVREEKERHGES